MAARWDTAQRAGKRSAKIVGGVAALLGAFTVVGSAGLYIERAAQAKYFWRDDVSRRLTSIRAGYTLGAVTRALGPPIVSNASPDGRYRNSIFRGHGYYAQTLTDRAATVLEYAVTACDPRLRPAFVPPGGGARIQLNRSTFWDVGGPESNVDFHPGSTGGSLTYFYEEAPGARPQDEKSVAWGLSDACSSWPDTVHVLRRLGETRIGSFGEYRGLTTEGLTTASRVRMKRIRQRVAVNTYMETAPDFELIDLEKLERAGALLHYGADRFTVQQFYGGLGQNPIP